MGNMAIKPSLTVELDAKSKTALLQIQQMTKSCFIGATIASTADIMKVFKGRPLQRVKKVVKKDWEDVANIAKTFHELNKRKIVFIAFNMKGNYAVGSELWNFWGGVCDAFDN